MKLRLPALPPRLLLGTGAVAFVVAYAAFVWPTPFHYTTYHYGGFTTTVRISRFTGRAEMLMPTGWRIMQVR